MIDGDTVHVYTDDKDHFRVRLHGIDAPEDGQPHADESTAYLDSLISDKPCLLEIVEPSDRYGRVVGILYQFELLESVNWWMIRSGMAFRWTKYGTLRDSQRADTIAKAQKLGVWQSAAWVPRPWDYRKQQRQEKYEERRQEALARRRRYSYPRRRNKYVARRYYPQRYPSPGSGYRTPKRRFTPSDAQVLGCLMTIVTFALIGILIGIEACKNAIG